MSDLPAPQPKPNYARCLKAYGINYDEVVRLNDGHPLRERGSKVDRYQTQRKSAIKRGIGWEITIAEWINLWNGSGKWAKRGVGVGFYCMARKGDVGPYKLGNVDITLFEVNGNEALARGKRSRATSEARGYSKTFKNRIKPYEAKLGKRVIGHFATGEEAHAAYLAAKTAQVAEVSA